MAVCLTVSHLDGLVLARCGFNHSVNYRAAMCFGTAAAVDDPDEKEKLTSQVKAGDKVSLELKKVNEVLARKVGGGALRPAAAPLRPRRSPSGRRSPSAIRPA